MPDRFFQLRWGTHAVTRRIRELRMIAKGLMSTDHPVMAHIIPIRRCNLSCAYCNEYDTWSKPVPVAPPTATHDQFFPALSVSPTGLVGVSWLDRRNDPANIDYQAFAAISTDGGQSFQPNWQLTTAFSNPETNGTQNNWMGDYTGSTWAGQDFIAAWMDSSNGVDMQEVVGGIRLH